MKSLNLLSQFSIGDSKKILQTLSHLQRHLPSFILTGGLASHYYFSKNNFPLNIREFNDLDVLIEHPSQLQNSVAKDFLISHFHHLNTKGKFHIMLVHKVTAVRIDIFPLQSKANQRTTTVLIENQEHLLLSVEDLVCRLLSNCLAVIENKTNDPKYFINLLSLFPLCNSSAIQSIWSEYSQGFSFNETYLTVVSKIKDHPELLKKNTYSNDLNAICTKCIDSDDFPLASNEEIFELLGYV